MSALLVANAVLADDATPSYDNPWWIPALKAVAIFVLLKYVQTRSYAIFVYYRWVIAAVILAVFFARMQ